MTKKTAPDNNSDSSTWESAKDKLVDALEQWNDLDQTLRHEEQVQSPDEKQRQRRHKLLKELETKIKELSR